jgi:glycosyltransferase involved in cell wall biosynthesis
MKVSIITVSYNSQSTIEQTILSVLEQTYQNIEYIIIDGASTDGTQQIIQQYRHKIEIVVSEKDKGIYDAMNKGISLATGDIIGILNSDDMYANTNAIQDVVNKLTETNAPALYADLVYVDKNNSEKIKRYWKSGPFKRSKFKWGWMPPHPTVFIRKEFYQKFGLFNLSLKSAADYELMLRFFYKENLVLAYLPQVITKMRTGGESNATVKNRLNANKEDHAAWKINGLSPMWLTLYFKPLRKIPQFIFRKPPNKSK